MECLHGFNPARYLRASAFAVVAVVLCGQVAGQTIHSEVTAFGSDDTPPAQRGTTNIPGAAVAASAEASFSFSSPRGSGSGTAAGSSFASTDYGVSRVSASGGLVGLSTDAGSGNAYVDTIALSSWTDDLIVSGGEVGDIVELSFSGRTNYFLGLEGGAAVVAPAVQLNQNFGARGVNGFGDVFLSNVEFAAHVGFGSVAWTLSVSARSGDVVGLFMFLNANLNSSFQGLGLGATNKSVVFDASHTALLTTLDVTNGYSLSSASGQLVANDGSFAYRAVLADGAVPATPVPEPETYALMLGGIAVIGLFGRQRRNLSRSSPPPRRSTSRRNFGSCR